MIEKELKFHYNQNLKYIFDITVNNNSEILKIIDDLREYKQGDWINNKRKDIIQFTFNDIPDDFKMITDLIIVDNVIPLKLKIELIENNDKKIIMKIKSNLINKLANLIYKLINIKFFITIEDGGDGISTDVKVRYIIKSFLPECFITKIDNYINDKLNNRFIAKIDNYLSHL